MSIVTVEITDIEDVKNLCFEIACGKIPWAIKIYPSYIKQYFFSVIKQYIPNIIIINCDSSEDRFENDIKHLHRDDVVIFDNIRKCPHFSNLNRSSMKDMFKNISKNILIW